MKLTATQWTDRLILADTLREPWREKVRESREQYLNCSPKTLGGENAIKANVFQASMRNIRAMLKPRTLEAKLFAEDQVGQSGKRVMQALVNQQARQCRLAREAGKFLQHMLLDGHAFFKVSWGIPETPRAIIGGNEDADMPSWQRTHGTRAIGNPATVMESMRLAHPRFLKGADRPVAVVTDTIDVLVDPDVTDILDSDWTAVRRWLDPNVIKARQKSKAYKDHPLLRHGAHLLPSSRDRWGDGQFATNQQDGRQGTKGRRTGLRGVQGIASESIPTDKVEVWEIHDTLHGMIYHLVPGMTDFLYEESMDFIPERPFLVDFKSDYIPTSYWVPPDNQQYIALQKDLDAVLNHMRDFVRRHGKQIILARKGMATPEELGMITRGQTADVIEVNDPNSYVPFPMTPMPGDFLNLTDIYMNFMSISSGVTPVASGAPTNEGASATEIATMARALSIRMDDLRVEMDRALEEVLGLFVDLNQRYMPQSVAIELLGADAQAFQREFLEVSGGPAAVPGKFRVEMVVGAAGETKQAVERQQTLQWYNLMAASPNSNSRAMDEEVHRIFGKNPERFMAPEQQPDLTTQMAEMAAQGGGAQGGFGRSLGEAGGAPVVSRDGASRMGAASEGALSGQAERGAA